MAGDQSASRRCRAGDQRHHRRLPTVAIAAATPSDRREVMRLADQVLEAGSTPAGHPLDADWKVWAGHIKQAVCYEIDSAVGALSHGMLDGNPLQVSIRTRPTVQRPISLWIEWLGPSASMGPKAHVPVAAGKTEPIRTGELIQSFDSGKRGIMSWMSAARQCWRGVFTYRVHRLPARSWWPYARATTWRCCRCHRTTSRT